eukprot:UN21461
MRDYRDMGCFLLIFIQNEKKYKRVLYITQMLKLLAGYNDKGYRRFTSYFDEYDLKNRSNSCIYTWIRGVGTTMVIIT